MSFLSTPSLRLLGVVIIAAAAGCSAYYTDYTVEQRLAAEERAAAHGGYVSPNLSDPHLSGRSRIRAPTSPGVLGDPEPPAAVSREGYPRRDGRRSPTDPNSPFDDRFNRRTVRDDVNTLAPRDTVRQPGVWERNFDPDR